MQSLVFKNEALEPYTNLIKQCTGEIIYDKIGRAHLLNPHSGHVPLKLRSSKYHGSSIVTHINDLYDILSHNNKPACIILSDGGPDYTPAGIVNIFYYRLFKELDVDFLSISTYAARYSAFKPSKSCLQSQA